MIFDFKVGLSVSSSPKSHKGELTMGAWAEIATKRFREQSSDTRRGEELELQRQSRKLAGAEKRWKELVHDVSEEVEHFNALMDRQFLRFHAFENELEVIAPKLSLKASIDYRVPEINFEYREGGLPKFPAPQPEETGEFLFLLAENGVFLTDSKGNDLSVKQVAAKLLDPLAV